MQLHSKLARLCLLLLTTTIQMKHVVCHAPPHCQVELMTPAGQPASQLSRLVVGVITTTTSSAETSSPPSATKSSSITTTTASSAPWTLIESCNIDTFMRHFEVSSFELRPIQFDGQFHSIFVLKSPNQFSKERNRTKKRAHNSK